jgi:tripartite-type tricarboxylate transporter receptor subunit TctC
MGARATRAARVRQDIVADDAARSALPRRGLLQAMAAACAAGVWPALAEYPERPVHLLVPFPPGALTDMLGRMVADRMQKALGQPWVVENRAGAGTLLGAAAVAKATPDGYQLMVATSTTLGISPAPDTPTLMETWPRLDLQAWQSIAAPAATPAAVVTRLNTEINRALATPDFKAELARVGVEARPMGVAEFNDMIRRDAPRWAELVKASGAKAN